MLSFRRWLDKIISTWFWILLVSLPPPRPSSIDNFSIRTYNWSIKLTESSLQVVYTPIFFRMRMVVMVVTMKVNLTIWTNSQLTFLTILSVSHDSVLPTAQHRRYLSMFFVLDHHWVLNVSCPIGVIFQSFTQAWKTAVGLHRLQSEQALHVCQGTLTDTPLRKYVISPF